MLSGKAHASIIYLMAHSSTVDYNIVLTLMHWTGLQGVKETNLMSSTASSILTGALDPIPKINKNVKMGAA